MSKEYDAGKYMIGVDTHTHTILSGHAWSTLAENVRAAKQRGMGALCLTEHGPRLVGGAPEYTPHSQRMVPPEVEGIRVYKGIEANILNPSGALDIPDKYLHITEFAIASFHALGGNGIVIGNEEENTSAYLKLMENPYIDTIGHADDPGVPCDLEALVLAAKINGKLCELNNNRIASGIYPSPRMKEYALLCKKHDQRICIGSDAHFYTMVGNVGDMMDLLASIDFPKELIVNLTAERFAIYIEERKREYVVMLMQSKDSVPSDVTKYFYSGGLNCAETTLRVLIEDNVIDAPIETVRMMTGFGGGMRRGEIFAAAISINNTLRSMR